MAREVLRRIPGMAAEIDQRVSSGQTPAPCITGRTAIYPAETIESHDPLAEQAVISARLPERALIRFRDVRLWPSSDLVSCRGRLLTELLSGRQVEALSAGRPIFWHFPSIGINDCTTTYQGLHPSNLYHWLIDDLPRLYALHADAVRSARRVVVLERDTSALPQAFQRAARSMVDALLPDNARVVRAPRRGSVQASEYLHLPRVSGEFIGYLPRDYTDFFRKRAFAALDLPPAPGRRRIHVSRRLARRRHLSNESELLSALKPFGFEDHCLENYAFRDQVRLMREASVVVGLHGAGLAHLIFATDCKVVEIHPSRPRHHMRWLCRAMGHEYAEVLAGQPAKQDDCTAPVNAILARLEQLEVRPGHSD